MAENKLVTKKASKDAEDRAENPPTTDGIIRESHGEWAPNEGNEAAEKAEVIGQTGSVLSQEDVENLPDEDRQQMRPT